MPPIVYLHGFASGPTSKKAQYFRQRFAERGVELRVPDLAAGDFDHLTISGQLHEIERACEGGPALLIGSSLGGYLAALYAERHAEVERLVLMAPAFNFAEQFAQHLGPETMLRWKQTGILHVQHYSDGLVHHLDYALIEDAQEYGGYPNFPQPAILFQGRRDEVVPPELAVTFAGQHPNVALRLVDSGHELIDVLDAMWAEVEPFLLSGSDAILSFGSVQPAL